MNYLLALVPDLDEAAVGTGLCDFEVTLGARGDAVVVEAALLCLVEQRALASSPQWRGAAGRGAARAAGTHRHAGRSAGLAARGLAGQVQPVWNIEHSNHASFYTYIGNSCNNGKKIIKKV